MTQKLSFEHDLLKKSFFSQGPEEQSHGSPSPVLRLILTSTLSGGHPGSALWLQDHWEGLSGNTKVPLLGALGGGGNCGESYSPLVQTRVPAGRWSRHQHLYLPKASLSLTVPAILEFFTQNEQLDFTFPW
jgi:hypothetical protein